MKYKGISVVLTLMVLAVTLSVPVLAKPTTVTVDFNQAQDQWRGSGLFGTWTYTALTSAISTDFELKGKTLHTSWSYSPAVTNLHGNATVYVYDKELEIWIEKEGRLSYVYAPGYGDHKVVNIFRGYLDFGGEDPSTANFVKGVAYQWVYLFAPETANLEGTSTAEAWWDETMHAWLVGFSIYRWTPAPPASALDFPDPFPKPIPANIFDPLTLP